MSTPKQTNPNLESLQRRTLRLQRESSREFHYALRRAKKAIADNQAELALHWCRHGAKIAVLSNPGFFCSPEMEQLLSNIGRSRLPSASSPSGTSGGLKRFLHILTVAYDRGGHTRAVSRWIDTCAQHAPSERHSVLLSMQDELPIPAWLVDSVRKGGGEIIELPPEMSWFERAAHMRSRSLEFDAIILHIHPDDPLPNIAFHDRPRPVMFFNHADHLFTLGTGLASVIADVRPVGHDLSLRFRSPDARKVMIPVPLPAPLIDDGPSQSRKADARNSLGLPVDALIALTIGEPYKFTSIFGYSFPAVVQSICKGNSRARVIAIGISRSEPFPGLQRLTGGQFTPVGFVRDRNTLELYYRAADIYLDSFPCTSITSVLDAARHGLPVQRFCNPFQPLMWSDDPALDSVMRGVSTQDEFVAGALRWLQWSDQERTELGSRFRAAVLRDHSGASWKSKWLDPAIRALSLPHGDPGCVEPARPLPGDFSFLGLGRASWAQDWPPGMFVAGAILNTDHVPRSIRISAIMHSIKPLLFDAHGVGNPRQRFRMFAGLVEPFVQNRIFSALRKMRRNLNKVKPASGAGGV